MCEIVPEVGSCCGVASIRVGLILIAVLSITSGALTLGVMEQRANINYDSVVQMYKNVSNYTQPEQALSDLSNIIPTTVTFMAGVFVFAGLLLLVATFWDQEGLAQIFTVLVLLNIVLGVLIIAAIGFECIWQGSKCFLGHMDWLSASCTLLAMICYLLVWFYFVSVANSFVLTAHT